MSAILLGIALIPLGVTLLTSRSPDEATLIRQLVPELKEVVHARRGEIREAAFVGRASSIDLAQRVERFLYNRPGWLVTTSYHDGSPMLLIASYSPLAAPRWWANLPLTNQVRVPDHRPTVVIWFYDGCLSRDDQPFTATGQWATLSLLSHPMDIAPSDQRLIEGWAVRRPS